LIDRGVGEDPTHTAIRKIHPVAVPFPVGALAGFPASCLSAARCVLAGPFSRWDLVEARGLRPTAREQRCAWRHPKPQTRAVRRIIQQRDDRWRFLDRSPPRDGATYRGLRTGLEPSMPYEDGLAVRSHEPACTLSEAIACMPSSTPNSRSLDCFEETFFVSQRALGRTCSFSSASSAMICVGSRCCIGPLRRTPLTTAQLAMSTVN